MFHSMQRIGTHGRKRARGTGGHDQRRFFAALAVSCLLLPLLTHAAPAQSGAPASSSPSDKNAAFQQAIHDYILAHPEVLIESLQRAKARVDAQRAALVKSKIMAFRKDLIDDPNAPVLGNPKGDVTLVEFFDYRCPYCRQVEPWLQTLLKEDAGVRLVQKEYPILGPASVYAARVAVAAWQEGKHTQFHNAMMATKGNIDEAVVLRVAQSAGLDVVQLKADLNKPDVDAEIQRSIAIARALGLDGTPAFVIGTELVPGATDLNTFREMVDETRHRIN